MLIVLSLVPATFGTIRLAQLAGGAEVTAANARFFVQPVPVVLHKGAARRIRPTPYWLNLMLLPVTWMSTPLLVTRTF